MGLVPPQHPWTLEDHPTGSYRRPGDHPQGHSPFILAAPDARYGPGLTVTYHQPKADRATPFLPDAVVVLARAVGWWRVVRVGRSTHLQPRTGGGALTNSNLRKPIHVHVHREPLGVTSECGAYLPAWPIEVASTNAPVVFVVSFLCRAPAFTVNNTA